jgi:hypothetical protein
MYGSVKGIHLTNFVEKINYSEPETYITEVTVQLGNPSRAAWFTGVCDVPLSGTRFRRSLLTCAETVHSNSHY